MGKRWRIHPHDSDRITRLERSAGVPAVVAQLLICRGVYDPRHARTFLEAKLAGLRDPETLPGVAAAVERIHDSVQAGRRIVIYGDYDADGMTATALVYRCLKMLGADVGYYVPNRMEEGYGLSHEALRTLASRKTDLVITVDCGIASLEEAETARQVGMELIVTDHHEMAERLPQAAAIVHPRLADGEGPPSNLCGAGVAFKLAWALCQRASQSKKVGQRMKDFLVAAVGLVAVGTVADVVPLLDENRILVRHGLASLKHQPLVGMATLMRITGLDKKPSLTSEDIGFTLAPRLNAAGRLGQAQLAIELLITETPQRAEVLAQYLDQLNNSRKGLEQSIYLAANKQAKERFDPEDDAALVLAGRGWHRGVIGIVAGRLAEKYNRPVALIALDELGGDTGFGSARSAGGLNLHAALAACGEHLLTHGGHAAAAGLTIDESRIVPFREDLCRHVAECIPVDQREAEIRIDAEAPLSQLTLRTVHQMEQLAPFGHGNPRPVLCTSGVTLAEPPRCIGSGQRHLSLKLNQHGVALRAVAFGRGDWADELTSLDGPLDIAYRPMINDFRGRRSVELHLVDHRVCSIPASVVES